MDDLPKRSIQQIIEKKSIDILSSALPKEWIIRHQSSDDYGIDLEVELVDPKGNVSGTFFKAQVKGCENIKINQNGEITLSGIKQSTLLYWLNLSKHIHIIIFLVDINTQEIYWAPVFWQACKLLDKNNSTKTVKFYYEYKNDFESMMLLIIKVSAESNYNKIRSFKWFLLNFEKINEFIDWCDNADYGSLVDDNFFKTILEEIRILCEEYTISNDAPSLEYYHWYRKSIDEYGDAVANFIAKIPLDYYFKKIILRLQDIIQLIKRSIYFWQHRDTHLTKLVQNLTTIEKNTKDYMITWVEKNIRFLQMW